MKRYDSYKDSRCLAFGEIPVDWDILRMKHLVDSSKYYQIGDGDHGSIKPEMYLFDIGIPYIRVQNLTWNGQLDFEGMVYISEELQEKNLKSKLIPNDILIAKTGATIGKLAIIPDRIKQANTTSSVGKITVDQNRFNSKYVLYSMMSRQFSDQIWIEASQKSAQPGFNVDDLLLLQIAVPKTLEEQTAIAAYLDRKTAEIDELIADKKRLLELYDEEKTAIINQAVTKGLPAARLSDGQGQAGLGEIPEHWKVKKIKHFTQILNGSTPKSTVESYWNGNINWVTTDDLGKLKTKDIIDSRRKITEKGFNNSGTYLAEEGSIVISTRAPIGHLGILRIKACTNQGCKTIVGDTKFNSEYLYYYLFSSKNFLNSLGVGTTFLELPTQSLRDYLVPLPPLEEQHLIVRYIETECARIDAKKSKTEKLIELLTEYRMALISEVVTGKVKVTG